LLGYLKKIKIECVFEKKHIKNSTENLYYGDECQNLLEIGCAHPEPLRRSPRLAAPPDPVGYPDPKLTTGGAVARLLQLPKPGCHQDDVQQPCDGLGYKPDHQEDQLQGRPSLSASLVTRSSKRSGFGSVDRLPHRPASSTAAFKVALNPCAPRLGKPHPLLAPSQNLQLPQP
jgi:hypothetical protein